MSLWLAAALAFGLATTQETPKKENRLFEMRTYYAAAGKLDALNARFRDHTTKLFEKHGITNIGYWTPTENPDNKLIYLLAFPDKEAREAAWKAFASDPDWDTPRKASEVNGKLVDKVESLLLTPTDYSPRLKVTTPKKQRVYELRIYKTFPDKMAPLHARFRDHTIGIMKRFGAKVLGFWNPTEKDKGAENTLIYLLAHKSQEKAKEMAEQFSKDPEWLKVKAETEKDGKLVEKVESISLTPTDYSTLR
jgi:hypothetical protein